MFMVVATEDPTISRTHKDKLGSDISQAKFQVLLFVYPLPIVLRATIGVPIRGELMFPDIRT